MIGQSGSLTGQHEVLNANGVVNSVANMSRSSMYIIFQ